MTAAVSQLALSSTTRRLLGVATSAVPREIAGLIEMIGYDCPSILRPELWLSLRVRKAPVAGQAPGTNPGRTARAVAQNPGAKRRLSGPGDRQRGGPGIATEFGALRSRFPTAFSAVT